jgi:hypothetical protein
MQRTALLNIRADQRSFKLAPCCRLILPCFAFSIKSNQINLTTIKSALESHQPPQWRQNPSLQIHTFDLAQRNRRCWMLDCGGRQLAAAGSWQIEQLLNDYSGARLMQLHAGTLLIDVPTFC